MNCACRFKLQEEEWRPTCLLARLKPSPKTSFSCSNQASPSFRSPSTSLWMPVCLFGCVLFNGRSGQRTREGERKRVQSSVQRCMQPCAIGPLIRRNQYHRASWDERSGVVTGQTGKTKREGEQWYGLGDRKHEGGCMSGNKRTIKEDATKDAQSIWSGQGGDEREERKLQPGINAAGDKGEVSLWVYLDSQVERGRCPARDTQCAGSSPRRQQDKETERGLMTLKNTTSWWMNKHIKP